MSFEIKPNRVDSQQEIVALIQANAPTPSAATPTVLGTVYGRISSLNTAIGYNSLFSNTTGTTNTASGSESLRSNTTGSSNTASGYGSLFSNTTGTQNTAVGHSSLLFNTTGGSNVAIGPSSLRFNTAGNFNVAIGPSSLFRNTTGYGNVSIGGSTGEDITTGYDNVFVGRLSGNNFTTQEGNVAIGAWSGYSWYTGSRNTLIGYQAASNIFGGDNNIIIGNGAGNINGRPSSWYNSIVLGNESIQHLLIPGLSLSTEVAQDGQVLGWSSTGGASGSGGFEWVNAGGGGGGGGGGSMTLIAGQTFDSSYGSNQYAVDLSSATGYKDLTVRVYDIAFDSSSDQITFKFLDGYSGQMGWNINLSKVVLTNMSFPMTQVWSESYYTPSASLASTNSFMEINVSDYNKANQYWRNIDFNVNFNNVDYDPYNETGSGFITGDPGMTYFLIDSSGNNFIGGRVEIYGIN